METKYCKNNPYHLIPESRRTDAIFCSIKCGSTFRNRKNAQQKKDIHMNEQGFYKNHKILKDLVGKGLSDISKETAKVLEFDFNCFTGIIKIDQELKTTEYKLFDFSYTIYGDRIKIKKIK